MYGIAEGVEMAGVGPNPGADSPAALPTGTAVPVAVPPTAEAEVAAQSTVAMAMLKSHELAEDRRRLLEAENRVLDAERQKALARERELARFD